MKAGDVGRERAMLPNPILHYSLRGKFYMCTCVHMYVHGHKCVHVFVHVHLSHRCPEKNNK